MRGPEVSPLLSMVGSRFGIVAGLSITGLTFFIMTATSCSMAGVN
jgi:hypothetical protein